MEDLICIRTYEAHTRPIHAVAARPNTSASFATASFDTFVTLWDISVNSAATSMNIIKQFAQLHSYIKQTKNSFSLILAQLLFVVCVALLIAKNSPFFTYNNNFILIQL